jgi:protein O-GlcNAc transferase
VSDEAFQVWAEVLLAVPESRMLLKNSELNHPEARARVTGKFTRAGVAAERLILLGGSRWEDHMAVFNQVDIALDTFPQGGGVTTLEGILMGVPLITLRRPTFAGRTGASFLTTLNLDDWIAHTPAQYVQIAMQKAQDVAGLARLRGQLRHHLMNSALGNGGAYAGLVEVEYRRLWRNWCDARDVSAV